MSSVEAASRPPWFRRLDALYFFLAAFDLLTICVALLLNHTSTTAFEEAVRASAASSAQQMEILQLADLARDATAPGDDVFASQEVELEHASHLRALARFDEEMARAKARFSANDPTDRQIARHLGDVERAMVEVRGHASLLFGEFHRSRVSAAGREMARMDRSFGVATEHLEQALSVVNRMRAQQLERQLSLARKLRRLEWIVGCALIMIVSLVAAYGLHVGRTLRAGQEQRAAMLNEIASARDRLRHYADDVSHELRGPISKMRLEAEVLLHAERTAKEYRDGVETMLIDCQRVSAMVESLLFLARAENTRVGLQLTQMDAAKELDVIVEFYAAAAEKAQVTLVVAGEPTTLWADRALFQRALSNLLNNALAHTPVGGRIALNARAVAEGVEVEVADTGPGIPNDLQERVFDRFQRGPNRKDADGLGLGLAITKSIMEIHGGAISLVNGERGGARATLYFPSRASASDALNAPREDYRAVTPLQ